MPVYIHQGPIWRAWVCLVSPVAESNRPTPSKPCEFGIHPQEWKKSQWKQARENEKQAPRPSAELVSVGCVCVCACVSVCVSPPPPGRLVGGQLQILFLADGKIEFVFVGLVPPIV